MVEEEHWGRILVEEEEERWGRTHMVEPGRIHTQAAEVGTYPTEDTVRLERSENLAAIAVLARTLAAVGDQVGKLAVRTDFAAEMVYPVEESDHIPGEVKAAVMDAVMDAAMDAAMGD